MPSDGRIEDTVTPLLERHARPAAIRSHPDGPVARPSPARIASAGAL